MSGIAITIPNTNFHTEFGNIITDLIDTPVTGISIAGNDYYVGTRYAMTVNYTPVRTSHRGCRWSIVSGSEYASIDENTGVITIFESANMNTVTVRAVSTYNSQLTATKEITLLYRRAANSVMSSTLGKLSNVDSEADVTYPTRKTLIKESGTGEWKVGDLPVIETGLTEDEVAQMIEDGTIDENTLYFCEE